MPAPLSAPRPARERPFVSVIIAVYNDPAGLLRCLAAIERQTYPADRYDVNVIDHASVPPVTIDPILLPHVRLGRETRPGVSRARQTGIETSRGEVLAFTDADCLPDRDWLNRGVERLLATPECGLVAGRIEVVARDPARPNVAEALGIAMHLKQERFLRGHWSVLANTFTFRHVVEKVGGPNTKLICSGDEEWGWRVHRAGFAQVYSPEACVQHPARATLRQLCLRTIRLEYGWREVRAETGIGRGVRVWLSQYLYRPMLNIVNDVVLSPKLGIVQRIQVAGLAAYLIGVRLLAWAGLALGVPFDARKNWG